MADNNQGSNRLKFFRELSANTRDGANQSLLEYVEPLISGTRGNPTEEKKETPMLLDMSIAPSPLEGSIVLKGGKVRKSGPLSQSTVYVPGQLVLIVPKEPNARLRAGVVITSPSKHIPFNGAYYSVSESDSYFVITDEERLEEVERSRLVPSDMSVNRIYMPTIVSDLTRKDLISNAVVDKKLSDVVNKKQDNNARREAIKAYRKSMAEKRRKAKREKGRRDGKNNNKDKDGNEEDDSDDLGYMEDEEVDDSGKPIPRDNMASEEEEGNVEEMEMSDDEVIAEAEGIDVDDDHQDSEEEHEEDQEEYEDVDSRERDDDDDVEEGVDPYGHEAFFNLDGSTTKLDTDKTQDWHSVAAYRLTEATTQSGSYPICYVAPALHYTLSAEANKAQKAETYAPLGPMCVRYPINGQLHHVREMEINKLSENVPHSKGLLTFLTKKGLLAFYGNAEMRLRAGDDSVGAKVVDLSTKAGFYTSPYKNDHRVTSLSIKVHFLQDLGKNMGEEAQFFSRVKKAFGEDNIRLELSDMVHLDGDHSYREIVTWVAMKDGTTNYESVLGKPSTPDIDSLWNDTYSHVKNNAVQNYLIRPVFLPSRSLDGRMYARFYPMASHAIREIPKDWTSGETAKVKSQSTIDIAHAYEQLDGSNKKKPPRKMTKEAKEALETEKLREKEENIRLNYYVGRETSQYMSYLNPVWWNKRYLVPWLEELLDSMEKKNARTNDTSVVKKSIEESGCMRELSFYASSVFDGYLPLQMYKNRPEESQRSRYTSDGYHLSLPMHMIYRYQINRNNFDLHLQTLSHVTAEALTLKFGVGLRKAAIPPHASYLQAVHNHGNFDSAGVVPYELLRKCEDDVHRNLYEIIRHYEDNELGPFSFMIRKHVHGLNGPGHVTTNEGSSRFVSYYTSVAQILGGFLEHHKEDRSTKSVDADSMSPERLSQLRRLIAYARGASLSAEKIFEMVDSIRVRLKKMSQVRRSEMKKNKTILDLDEAEDPIREKPTVDEYLLAGLVNKYKWEFGRGETHSMNDILSYVDARLIAQVTRLSGEESDNEEAHKIWLFLYNVHNSALHDFDSLWYAANPSWPTTTESKIDWKDPPTGVPSSIGSFYDSVRFYIDLELKPTEGSSGDKYVVTGKPGYGFKLHTQIILRYLMESFIGGFDGGRHVSELVSNGSIKSYQEAISNYDTTRKIINNFEQTNGKGSSSTESDTPFNSSPLPFVPSRASDQATGSNVRKELDWTVENDAMRRLDCICDGVCLKNDVVVRGRPSSLVKAKLIETLKDVCLRLNVNPLKEHDVREMRSLYTDEPGSGPGGEALDAGSVSSKKGSLSNSRKDGDSSESDMESDSHSEGEEEAEEEVEEDTSTFTLRSVKDYIKDLKLITKSINPLDDTIVKNNEKKSKAASIVTGTLTITEELSKEARLILKHEKSILKQSEESGSGDSATAAETKFVESMELLRKKLFQMEHGDFDGNSPHHYSIACGGRSYFKVYRTMGTDPNTFLSVDNEGNCGKLSVYEVMDDISENLFSRRFVFFRVVAAVVDGDMFGRTGFTGPDSRPHSKEVDELKESEEEELELQKDKDSVFVDTQRMMRKFYLSPVNPDISLESVYSQINRIFRPDSKWHIRMRQAQRSLLKVLMLASERDQEYDGFTMGVLNPREIFYLVGPDTIYQDSSSSSSSSSPSSSATDDDKSGSWDVSYPNRQAKTFEYLVESIFETIERKNIANIDYLLTGYPSISEMVSEELDQSAAIKKNIKWKIGWEEVYQLFKNTYLFSYSPVERDIVGKLVGAIYKAKTEYRNVSSEYYATRAEAKRTIAATKAATRAAQKRDIAAAKRNPEMDAKISDFVKKFVSAQRRKDLAKKKRGDVTVVIDDDKYRTMATELYDTLHGCNDSGVPVLEGDIDETLDWEEQLAELKKNMKWYTEIMLNEIDLPSTDPNKPEMHQADLSLAKVMANGWDNMAPTTASEYFPISASQNYLENFHHVRTYAVLISQFMQAHVERRTVTRDAVVDEDGVTQPSKKVHYPSVAYRIHENKFDRKSFLKKDKKGLKDGSSEITELMESMLNSEACGNAGKFVWQVAQEMKNRYKSNQEPHRTRDKPFKNVEDMLKYFNTHDGLYHYSVGDIDPKVEEKLKRRSQKQELEDEEDKALRKKAIFDLNESYLAGIKKPIPVRGASIGAPTFFTGSRSKSVRNDLKACMVSSMMVYNHEVVLKCVYDVIRPTYKYWGAAPDEKDSLEDRATKLDFDYDLPEEMDEKVRSSAADLNKIFFDSYGELNKNDGDFESALHDILLESINDSGKTQDGGVKKRRTEDSKHAPKRLKKGSDTNDDSDDDTDDVFISDGDPMIESRIGVRFTTEENRLKSRLDPNKSSVKDGSAPILRTNGGKVYEEFVPATPQKDNTRVWLMTDDNRKRGVSIYRNDQAYYNPSFYGEDPDQFHVPDARPIVIVVNYDSKTVSKAPDGSEDYSSVSFKARPLNPYIYYKYSVVRGSTSSGPEDMEKASKSWENAKESAYESGFFDIRDTKTLVNELGRKATIQGYEIVRSRTETRNENDTTKVESPFTIASRMIAEKRKTEWLKEVYEFASRISSELLKLSGSKDTPKATASDKEPQQRVVFVDPTLQKKRFERDADKRSDSPIVVKIAKLLATSKHVFTANEFKKYILDCESAMSPQPSAVGFKGTFPDPSFRPGLKWLLKLSHRKELRSYPAPQRIKKEDLRVVWKEALLTTLPRMAYVNVPAFSACEVGAGLVVDQRTQKTTYKSTRGISSYAAYPSIKEVSPSEMHAIAVILRACHLALGKVYNSDRLNPSLLNSPLGNIGKDVFGAADTYYSISRSDIRGLLSHLHYTDSDRAAHYKVDGNSFLAGLFTEKGQELIPPWGRGEVESVAALRKKQALHHSSKQKEASEMARQMAASGKLHQSRNTSLNVVTDRLKFSINNVSSAMDKNEEGSVKPIVYSSWITHILSVVNKIVKDKAAELKLPKGKDTIDAGTVDVFKDMFQYLLNKVGDILKVKLLPEDINNPVKYTQAYRNEVSNIFKATTDYLIPNEIWTNNKFEVKVGQKFADRVEPTIRNTGENTLHILTTYPVWGSYSWQVDSLPRKAKEEFTVNTLSLALSEDEPPTPIVVNNVKGSPHFGPSGYDVSRKSMRQMVEKTIGTSGLWEVVMHLGALRKDKSKMSSKAKRKSPPKSIDSCATSIGNSNSSSSSSSSSRQKNPSKKSKSSKSDLKKE